MVRQMKNKQSSKLSMLQLLSCARKKKEDHARILKLTELAYKKDPRISRHAEEVKQAKIAKKEAKKAELLRKQQKVLPSIA